jgi:hypothetical protein
VIEYQCDCCHVKDAYLDGPKAYYVLPDDRSFFAPHGVGWCHDCGGLSEVEELKTVSELEALVAAIDEIPDILDMYPPHERERVRQSLRDGFALQMELARLRTAPMRCLRCGGRNFIALVSDDTRLLHKQTREEFSHPGCGGHFVFMEMYFSQPVGCCLSVEGELLEGRWKKVIRRK